MNGQQQNQMVENSTKLTFFIISSLSSNLISSSSPPPDGTRTAVSTMYIAGIIFMVTVFLLLLWVNLFSRHCWCWHDTSFTNRFNRQWLIRRSMMPSNDSSSSKHRYQRRPSNEDELEWISSFENYRRFIILHEKAQIYNLIHEHIIIICLLFFSWLHTWWVVLQVSINILLKTTDPT